MSSDPSLDSSYAIIKMQNTHMHMTYLNGYLIPTWVKLTATEPGLVIDQHCTIELIRISMSAGYG